jgi:preprotein translocase subunit SecB
MLATRNRPGRRNDTEKGTTMADQNNTTGGEQSQQNMARVAGQYIKDLSFENPNIRKLIDNPGVKPNIRVEVNVNAGKMTDKLYESAIQFKAEASNETGVIYDLELAYGGLFQVENMDDETLEVFLMVNAPALLFPYLRRLVADITREGGFPPLTLEPIDFGGMFMRRKQEKISGLMKVN